MKPRSSTAAERRVTITDVARSAGVAPSTVSFVLNETPGQTIRPETVKRIQAAAKKLHYQPNAQAQALRRGHSQEICHFVTGPLDEPLTADLALAIQARARELGYTVALYLFHSLGPKEWKALLRDVLARRPAGFIGSTVSIHAPEYRLAKRNGVQACVLMGHDPVGFAPVVQWAWDDAARVAGQHLLERGHRRVACIIPTYLDAALDDLLGHVRRALADALELGGAEIVPFEVDMTMEGVRSAVRTLLSSTNRPTAIYGFRDAYCMPVLRALAECGARVPGDMAVVGTDDSLAGALYFPSLSSVRFDLRTMGRQMIDLLHAQLRGEPVPDLVSIPPPVLVVRESS